MATALTPPQLETYRQAGDQPRVQPETVRGHANEIAAKHGVPAARMVLAAAEPVAPSHPASLE